MNANGLTHRPTTLVVDDRPIDRDLVAALVGHQGHSALLAADGIEALAIVRSENPDLVITDVVMPRLDGFEMIRRMRNDPATAKIPVIVYSGNCHSAEAHDLAERLGVSSMLYKPVDPEVLLGAVNTALAFPTRPPPPSAAREFDAIHGRIVTEELLHKVCDFEARGAELRDSQAKFRTIFESSLDAVAINVHPGGEYLEVNPEFERLTGFARADAIGRTPASLGTWLDDAALIELLRRLRERGEIRNFEARLRRRDGSTAWVAYSATIVEISARRCVLSFIRDIDDQRRARDELAVARDQALQASRLKSAILANISHEVRTPLNVILGFTRLIAEHTVTAERELVDPIQRASNRLMRTIDTVLDIAKIECGDFELDPAEIAVAPLVAEVAARFQTEAVRKRLELRFSFDDAAATVTFDRHCLEEMFVQLLDNAVKFTDAGEVAVRVHRDEERRVCVDVKDTGVGMEPSFVERLCEPFSQEDPTSTRRFEGMGLGLALVRRYADLNGANLSVDSEKGCGTLCRIRFGESREIAPARAPILVVDDDVDTLAYMEAVLGPTYAVLTATRGEEVRTQLEAHPDVAAVLMDISLRSSESGLDLTRMLRASERWKNVPVIATTAHALPEDRRKAVAAGCDVYLTKPFDYGELLVVLQQLISSRRKPACATA